MTEATFWTQRLRLQLLRECRNAGWTCDLERVENAVSAGTFDVDYCIAGVAGKLELKYAARVPVRDTSRVLPKGKGLRRSQVIRSVKRARAGGRVGLVIGTPGPVWYLDLRRLSARELYAIEAYSVIELIERCDWWSLGDHVPLAAVIISS